MRQRHNRENAQTFIRPNSPPSFLSHSSLFLLRLFAANSLSSSICFDSPRPRPWRRRRPHPNPAIWSDSVGSSRIHHVQPPPALQKCASPITPAPFRLPVSAFRFRQSALITLSGLRSSVSGLVWVGSTWVRLRGFVPLCETHPGSQRALVGFTPAKMLKLQMPEFASLIPPCSSCISSQPSPPPVHFASIHPYRDRGIATGPIRTLQFSRIQSDQVGFTTCSHRQPPKCSKSALPR